MLLHVYADIICIIHDGGQAIECGKCDLTLKCLALLVDHNNNAHKGIFFTNVINATTDVAPGRASKSTQQSMKWSGTPVINVTAWQLKPVASIRMRNQNIRALILSVINVIIWLLDKTT